MNLETRSHRLARRRRRTPAGRAAIAASVIALLAGLGACGDDEGSQADEPAADVGSSVGGRAPETESSPSTTADPTTTAPPTSGSSTETTEATTETTATDPPPAEPGPLNGVQIALEPLVELDQPVKALARPGSGLLYVAEQGGRVQAVDPDDPADPSVALDLGDLVLAGGEQGLLGLAFAPDGSTMYVHHSGPDGETRVASYSMDGDVADPASRVDLLTVDQPYPNHNGGELLVDDAGLLWIGLGDGGAGDDPEARAQDPDDLLGKILRIDPSSPGDGRPYGIPADNPFAGGGGRPEIAVMGVRNPWRMRFDDATGDLWVADVGQNEIEEIDRIPADAILGANLGWSRFEGSEEYLPDRPLGPGEVLGPVYEVLHDDGWCSISGGAVYRGSEVPDLVGAYLFGDFCKAGLFAIRGGQDGSVTDVVLDGDVANVVSIDTDADGEVLVLSLDGTVYRLVAA